MLWCRKAKDIDLDCVTEKFPSFELSVSSSNPNIFSKLLVPNLYNITLLTVGMLLHYVGRLKFQIYCTYSAHIEKIDTNCILCAPILFPIRM